MVMVNYTIDAGLKNYRETASTTIWFSCFFLFEIRCRNFSFERHQRPLKEVDISRVASKIILENSKQRRAW